jgi:acetyl esterase/lipase
MSLWTLLGGAGRSAWRVAARRWREGPRLASWSYTYEAVQAHLREQFQADHLPPTVIRQRLDAAGALAPERLWLREQWVSLGGSPASRLRAGRRSRGVLFYLHGGGYVFGSPRSHRTLLARLAWQTQREVVALDYRKAPEHPCPAPIEDTLAAWRALLQEGHAPQDVVWSGDSAGGGLALASLLALRDAGDPLPGRVALLSPWADLTVTAPSAALNEADFLGPAEQLRKFALHYAGSLRVDDPRVSPLFAADLSGLPPMLLLAGGAERLRDDAVRLAARLQEARVPTQLHVEPDEVHVYPVFAAVSPRAAAGVRRLAGFLGQVTG